jgi:hypothetical protein
MTWILGGLGVIAIGLLLSDSVLLGDFTIRSILFDALGVFFIIRGFVSMYRAKQQEAMSAPPAPPPTGR